jgi:hypothetical protein
MKGKKYSTVGTVPKSNRTIIEKVAKSIPLAHDRTLYLIDTDTSIKMEGLS